MENAENQQQLEQIVLQRLSEKKPEDEDQDCSVPWGAIRIALETTDRGMHLAWAEGFADRAHLFYSGTNERATFGPTFI